MTADVINYDLGISVEGGPDVDAIGNISVEAKDEIEVTVVKNSVVATVDVQPSINTQLLGLIVTADVYGTLSFTVDADPTIFTLDGPIALIGSGPISLLGATVNQMLFTNSNVTTDRTVNITVFRTAKVA